MGITKKNLIDIFFSTHLIFLTNLIFICLYYLSQLIIYLKMTIIDQNNTLQRAN